MPIGPWYGQPVSSGRARVACATAGLVTVLSLSAGCSDSAERADGPLTGLEGLGSAVDDYGVGERFATGLTVVFNPSDGPLRIESVRPVAGEGSLRFLGAKIAGYERTIGNTDVVEWPIRAPELGAVEDASGYTFEPGEQASTRGVELLLGYEVTEPGRTTVRGVEVEYSVGDAGTRRSSR